MAKGKMTHSIGDLLVDFRSPLRGIDAIAHVCNCKGVMGGGIALQIRQQFPCAYSEYKDYENLKGLKLGTVSDARLANGKIIFNLHAQDDYDRGQLYRRFLNYEALYVALEYVQRCMRIQHQKCLGVPFLMGCDRAGGNWRVVHAMLEHIFCDNGMDVHTTEYDQTD
jgi:hypothetical protein